jgi:hypothetical protein
MSQQHQQQLQPQSIKNVTNQVYITNNYGNSTQPVDQLEFHSNLEGQDSFDFDDRSVSRPSKQDSTQSFVQFKENSTVTKNSNGDYQKTVNKQLTISANMDFSDSKNLKLLAQLTKKSPLSLASLPASKLKQLAIEHGAQQ